MLLRNLLISIVFVTTVLSLTPNVLAIVQYKVDVSGDNAFINVTFELYTDNATEKVNYWRATFILPDKSEILSIDDSRGKIENYTIVDTVLTFKTNNGAARNREVVSIFLRVSDIVNKDYYPLKRINLSLSGFSDKRSDIPDELTFVELKTDERIISDSHSFGFISEINDTEIKYQGEGPINFNVFYSDSGEEYEHYILFGHMNITRADDMYGIIVAATGIIPTFDKFPVVVLDNETYEEKINDWSVGEYREGLIVIKKSESEKDTGTATLLHETTHGFNAEVLRWSDLEISWFDEGVAKYVEFLVNKNLGVRQAEIFGDPIKWQEGRTIYTLQPREKPDDLWDYYQNNQDFMKTWNTKNPSTRAFGYAFSELMIREHILKNGPESLHDVYQELLSVEEKAETSEEYNSIILNALNSDMKPCYSANLNDFEACLKEVNNMSSDVPNSVNIEGKKENITIIPIELPEPEPEPEDFFTSLWNSFLGFFEWLGSFFGG